MNNPIFPSQNLVPPLSQTLIFVTGKGGVGRSTVCAALGKSFAKQGARTLIVQWSMVDALSPLFHRPRAFHTPKEVLTNLWIMNFDTREAIREYFVEHLKLKLMHTFIIENKQVQKLIQAAPGISELFFLGRLFWLVELSQKEKGYTYDKIIVDTPATGHGVSLFGIAPAVAKLGVTGPLAMECERVSTLLKNKGKTALLFVALPEELAILETQEFLPSIQEHLGYNPTAIILNQSVSEKFFPNLENMSSAPWFLGLKKRLGNTLAHQIDLAHQFLINRLTFEEQLAAWAGLKNINLLKIPDLNLYPSIEEKKLEIEYVTAMENFFSQDFAFSNWLTF